MSKLNEAENRLNRDALGSLTKQDLMIAVWEELDCESVGARELEQIQMRVSEHFGQSAVDSPATIARLLADEGANLRHPEVIVFDVQWRTSKLEKKPDHIFSFANLAEASEQAIKIEVARRELRAHEDQPGQQELEDFVVKIRDDYELLSTSPVVEENVRAELGEVSTWLTIWLRTPELFLDWLELRLSSPEFQEKFGKV